MKKTINGATAVAAGCKRHEANLRSSDVCHHAVDNTNVDSYVHNGVAFDNAEVNTLSHSAGILALLEDVKILLKVEISAKSERIIAMRRERLRLATEILKVDSDRKSLEAKLDKATDEILKLQDKIQLIDSEPSSGGGKTTEMIAKEMGFGSEQLIDILNSMGMLTSTETCKVMPSAKMCEMAGGAPLGRIVTH